MSKQNKEYNNVFAKIAENHNNEIVPILKYLNLSTVKIRPRRIVSLRDTLEIAEKVSISIDLFTEYIVTNSIIFKLIDQKELYNSFDLIKTKEKSNVFIGINCIYALIEEKKTELLNKI